MTPQQKHQLDLLLANFAVACVHGSEESQRAHQHAIYGYVDGMLPEYDLLRPVLESSEELVFRFRGYLTERGTFKKFNEEVDEFKKAIYAYQARHGMVEDQSEDLKQEVARELVDVLVTAGGMAAFAGVTWQDIRPAVEHVLDKNIAKNPKTHRWDDTSQSVVKLETSS